MAMPTHIVACGGLVEDFEGNILIVKTHHGGWVFPGGQVEVGENLMDGVIREVKEESGIEVDVVRLSGVYKNVGAKGTCVVSLVFLCRAVGGKPTAGDETSEVGWFSPEEAMRLVTRERMRIRLQDALSGRETPAVRSFMTPEKGN